MRCLSVLGWFRTQAKNVLLMVEGTPTCWVDISTAFRQELVDDRSGERSAVQVVDLRMYGACFPEPGGEFERK